MGCPPCFLHLWWFVCLSPPPAVGEDRGEGDFLSKLHHLRITLAGGADYYCFPNQTGYNGGNSENTLAFTTLEGESNEENRLSPENFVALGRL